MRFPRLCLFAYRTCRRCGAELTEQTARWVRESGYDAAMCEECAK